MENHSKNLVSADNPCPVCGSENFTWGMPMASPSIREFAKVFIYFKYKVEDEHGIPLSARLCNQCGNVMFFIIDK